MLALDRLSGIHSRDGKDHDDDDDDDDDDDAGGAGGVVTVVVSFDRRYPSLM